jgi:hypothetical protein
MKRTKQIATKGTEGTKRGGRRAGAGRPKLDRNVPTEEHVVTATTEDWAIADELGDGNRSLGIRRSLRGARRRKEKIATKNAKGTEKIATKNAKGTKDTN